MVCSAFLVLGSIALHGAQPVITLWPEGVPGLKASAGEEKYQAENGRLSNVHHPTLTVYAAEHPNGTAVIVCPGGSYLYLTFPKEGIEPAQFLNRHGVSVYGVDPKRIGVLGFSAGGHLAGSAGTLFDDPLGKTGAPLDAVSGRPDFMMLVYPVITMTEPYAHPGSRKALLGAAPTPAQVAHWSLEQRVTAATPPTFLVATEEDKTVPAQNTLMFYTALLKAHVPAELHLYEKGPHGFALRLTAGPTAQWPDRAVEWMQSHGWVPPATPAAGSAEISARRGLPPE